MPMLLTAIQAFVRKEVRRACRLSTAPRTPKAPRDLGRTTTGKPAEPEEPTSGPVRKRRVRGTVRGGK